MNASPTPAQPPHPQPSPPPRRRWIKVLTVLVFGCAAVLALGFAWIHFQGWRGLRHWKQYEKQLAAAGEKLSLLDLAPTPVPDEKNFALHPLIGRWFAPRQKSTNSTAQWFFAPGAEDPSLRRYASGPARAEGQAQDLLQRWSAYYKGHRAFPQAPAGAPPAEVVRTALSLYDADLQSLRKAMQERPLCRYPLNYDEGSTMSCPHLIGLRNLAATLQLRMVANLELGRSEEAFEELRLGFFLCDTLKNDPLMLSHLVRLAMDQLLREAVREGLCQRRWNDQQLAWLADYLARRSYLEEYADVLRAERNLVAHRTELQSQGKVQAAATDPESDLPPDKTLKFLPRGMYYEDLERVVRVYQEVIGQAIRVKERRLDKPILESADARIQQMASRRLGLTARQLTPPFKTSGIKVARWQSQSDALLVACAMERYRLATQNWPPSLDALVPQYLAFVPRDVFTGAPLKLRQLPKGGWRIYACGWDGDDDGGQPGRQAEAGDWGVEITAPVSSTAP